jgi:hypothetical protein
MDELASLEEEKLMKKICVAVFVLLASCGFALAQEKTSAINQKDIDEFLSFADDYKASAEKYIKNAKNKSISEIFYSTDNSRWVSQTEVFLKKAGWSFDKMNQFLYTVYLALLAINYSDTYGDVSKAEGGNLFEDIPDSVKRLVKANLARLNKYFPKEDYAAFAEDSDSSEGANAAGDKSAETDDSGADVIHGDIAVAVKTDNDVQVSVVFESGADELVMRAAILKAGKEIAKGETKTIKPWTVKGGHIEHTWTFSKKTLGKGSYAASVTITDKDGFEVGAQNAEFTVN